MENCNLYLSSDGSLPKVTSLSDAEREGAMKRLIEYAGNCKARDANYADLLKQYTDRWIGIHRQRVITAAVTREAVQEKLKELGIYKDGELIEFMSGSGDCSGHGWHGN